MAFISLQHVGVLQATGGREGVLKPDLLESVVEKPVVSVGGDDAYSTLFLKVSAIGHGIAHGHVFNDGNKRTAIQVMTACLAWNGYKRRPNPNAVEVAILLVAAGFLGIDGLRLALLYAYGLDAANQDL